MFCTCKLPSYQKVNKSMAIIAYRLEDQGCALWQCRICKGFKWAK